MKNIISAIKQSFFLMLAVVVLPTFANEEAFEKRWDSLETMSQELAKISEKISPVAFESPTPVAPQAPAALSEFEIFQTSLVSAMVTDPIYNENRQMVSDRALKLTSELKENLKSLQKFQSTASKLGIEKDFKEYLAVVSSVIKEREERHYTVARAKLKELMLSETFERLQKSVKNLKTLPVTPTATVASVPPKVKPEFAKLMGMLTKAQSTLALLREENLQNIALLEKNKMLVKKNEETYAQISKRAVWIEKLAWSVLATAAVTAGLGLYLFLFRFLGFLGLVRVPVKSSAREELDDGESAQLPAFSFSFIGAGFCWMKNSLTSIRLPKMRFQKIRQAASSRKKSSGSVLVEGHPQHLAVAGEQSGILERLPTTAMSPSNSNERPAFGTRPFTRWNPPVSENKGFTRADFTAPSQVLEHNLAPASVAMREEEVAQGSYSTFMEDYLPDYVPQHDVSSAELNSFAAAETSHELAVETPTVAAPSITPDSDEEYLNEPMVFAAPNLQIVEETPAETPAPRARKNRTSAAKGKNPKRREAEQSSWSIREHAAEESDGEPNTASPAAGEPTLRLLPPAKKPAHSIWDRDPLKDIFEGII